MNGMNGMNGMMDAAATLPNDGVWRYGVSLGYYVPFFDFN
jgi:hypothetical protein